MADAMKAAVKSLAADGRIAPDVARAAMEQLMRGEATPAQTGAFLALLSLDRCTPEVVFALAEVMRESATAVDVPRMEDEPTVDIVGTGGDGQDTFNISTAASFVTAGAGCRVVKHGNRSASSKSGAADTLEAMGARLDLRPDEAATALSASGMTFLFARAYHPAMRFVGPARAELGIRTVFNILGPLTNPGRPDCMLCGVFSPNLGGLFAEVFKMLGMKRAMVVHGLEVLDELSIEGPSRVWELREDGSIEQYEVTAEDFGLPTYPLSAVASGTATENAAEMWETLGGRGREAVRDMIAMNAGAALYVTGKAADFKSGAKLAKEAMTDGRALRVAELFVEATSGKRLKRGLEESAGDPMAA